MRCRGINWAKITKHNTSQLNTTNQITNMSLVGVRCPGVNWDSFSLEDLKLVVECIGAAPLARVLRLLARDYRHLMGGLPDLLLWRPDASMCVGYCHVSYVHCMFSTQSEH